MRMGPASEEEGPSMIASPTKSGAVSESLREYLQLQLGVDDLRYVKSPSPSNEGWETFIYRFQIAGDGLPEDFSRPT